MIKILHRSFSGYPAVSKPHGDSGETSDAQRSRSGLLGLSTYLSWLGLFIHNYVESVDGSTLAIGLVSALLFLTWWRIPSRRSLSIRLLLALAILQLVGATVTVMPFSFLPFSPAQNLEHYLAHAVYGALQLPLIGETVRSK